MIVGLITGTFIPAVMVTVFIVVQPLASVVMTVQVPVESPVEVEVVWLLHH